MKRTVGLRFGKFSRESIEQRCDRFGIGLASFLRQATVHYVADRESGRPDWPYPHFMRERPRGRSAVTVELEPRG